MASRQSEASSPHTSQKLRRINLNRDLLSYIRHKQKIGAHCYRFVFGIVFLIGATSAKNEGITFLGGRDWNVLTVD